MNILRQFAQTKRGEGVVTVGVYVLAWACWIAVAGILVSYQVAQQVKYVA